MTHHRPPLRVQLPVPPPAPPEPPPAEPVPPPAPEPDPAPLALPALPLDDPVAPPSPALPPEGAAGVLSGGMTGPPVAPDFGRVAPASSLDAAKAASDVADNKPASNSEVILMFIGEPLQKMSGYLRLVVGAGWLVPVG